ncbi:hypothetical protein PsorP6_008906 [Peronosclerospora sorghi]|uniref:Uncharacterized protein n=1 Tax=Peronosclerospora sorghi TaxID=230839 RepID=A0ACC0VZT2_9STRA|nr:hypothetical protein PsorP6_008906 [Peronosclerospora sorghi]
MLVGVSGDPEQNASSVEAIDYDNVKITISTLQSATYRPGEAIIRERHAGAHNVYLLLDGEAEVTCKNPIKKVPPTNVTDEDVPSTNMSESRPSWSGVRSETSRARETKLRRFPKGACFCEIDLVRPDGRFLPRIATYRCAERSNTPCKVLQHVADDFLNLQGAYDSIKARLEKTAHRHIEQHLLKCVEAANWSVKMRTLNTGDFIYKEVVEELYPGDYFPLSQNQASKIDTSNSSVRCTQPVKVVEIGGETLSSNKFLAAYFCDEVMARERRRLIDSRRHHSVEIMELNEENDTLM